MIFTHCTSIFYLKTENKNKMNRLEWKYKNKDSNITNIKKSVQQRQLIYRTKRSVIAIKQKQNNIQRKINNKNKINNNNKNSILI